MSKEGETVVIQLPRGRRIFRSTCVRPWVRPTQDGEHLDEGQTLSAAEDTPHISFVGQATTEYLDKDETSILGTTPRKVPVKRGSIEEAAFAQSRKSELNGLINDGTFIPVHESTIRPTARIFNSRFVDELKKVGDQLKKKSRLVAQNYADIGATSIPTKAPTVQRFSQRIALCIAACLPHLKPFTRDITQAYIQSHTDLEREVYIRAPRELGLPEGYILKVVKPLYGIPESGLHWYLTYLAHHLDTLHMTRARCDPCVLIRRSNDRLDGLILLQVDDSLGIGTPKFWEDEEIGSKSFRCKPRTKLSEKPTSFNGIFIKHQDGRYTIDQQDKIEKLTIAKTQKEFSSMRALAQYIGVNTRPDICAPIQLIAPGNKQTTTAEFKSLTKTTNFLTKTKNQGLDFIKLNLESARIVLATDASFANTADLKSQLGYFIMLVDDKQRCNVLHYGSNKCQRIARSVMAAEIQALMLGFDYAFYVRDLLEEILGRSFKIEAMIDSKTVFNVVAKDGKTTERRLQIDILSLRESYDNGELNRIAWIPGPTNPADPLTKPALSTTSPLFKIMEHNMLDIAPQGWAQSHEGTPPGVSM